jgi:5-methylcytosine-specific restriction endonuclease McrA
METVSVEERARRRARNRKALDNAVRRRERLIEELAPDLLCAECGQPHPVTELYVDHVNGIRYEHTKLSPSARASRYWKEHREGEPLRALCRACSGRDGQRRMGRARYRRS